jgi:3-hydroxyacyl-CoA dehydrogenase
VTVEAMAEAGTGRTALSQAPAFIRRCVEAALSMPFENGMALEKQLFEALRLSEASIGLRHVFLGRREVGRIPGGQGGPAAPISSVAVIGAGLMGTGIATALIQAGLKVDLIEPQTAVMEKSLAAIRATLQRDVAKGRMTQNVAAERLDLLSPGETMDGLAAADLMIEAVFEDMDVKRQVFREADRLAKPSAILASNTSTLDLNVIAGFTARPDRVVGLHFFSPANIMKLVEIVRGDRTSPQTLAASLQFTRRIGKIGVVSGVCDGFIGNRMFEEYLRQAYFLLEEGALPQQVDAALEAFGMAMGPFKVMDLAGQDIGWSIRKRRAQEQPDRPYSRIPDLVCEMGRYGQKTGAGFYLYPDGRTPQIDPSIDTLVMAYSRKIGAARRAIGEDEIVERCVFALINEGAKILEEGIAYRPVDIDMIYVHGYGFPPSRGGPMFYADRLGLKNVLERILMFRAGGNGWAWEPAALLVRLARAGGSFATMASCHD